MKKKLPLLLFVMVLAAFQSFGQTEVQMADVMRSNGKIYVVVTVAAIVMTGILVYLFMLDRKISSLEKKVNNKTES